MRAESVGRRVVVRYRVGGVGPTGGPAMTDVVGRLLAMEPDQLTVERRDGSQVQVPVDQIVTSKEVPDRPIRSRLAGNVTAEELTRITSRGWPAIESQPLGEWELRASRGFTGRANSVAAVGDHGVAFDAALGSVVDFYRQRGLPPTAQVISDSPTESAFLAAGWAPLNGNYGQAVVQVTQLSATYQDDESVDFAADATDEWLELYGRVSDPQSARAVMEAPTTVRFASIGTPSVAIGRIVVTGEWAGISAVEVLPEVRRQGMARRLVQACLAWAVEQGADKAYLQTMPNNHAALALYEPFGFVDHHRYRYLVAPESQDLRGQRD